MHLVRRRSVVCAAVVLGLLVPSASIAVAAGAADSSTGGKQARLEQLRSNVAKKPASADPKASHALRTLAVQRESGKVVLAVKVRGGANVSTRLADVARAAKAQGAQQRRVLRQLGTVSIAVPQGQADQIAAQLRQRSDVARVDVVVRKTLSFVPNDEYYSTTAPYLDAISAPAAWDVHQGDATVKIAVVDSGVDVSHPDLVGRISDTYNAVDSGTDVTDTVGHGTFVAGVAAATGNNGIGVAGAAMGASVMAVKVADSTGQIWSDAEAAGIDWAADHGAKVINLSLGSDTPTQLESDAVAYAQGKGVLVVAAAGNDATTTPSYPAAYPQVVAVGATDAAGHRAPFSEYGSWVTVGAPGTGIHSTTPTSGTIDFQPNYDVADGTSFSSPLVAAEAALLWSMRPAVNAADVRAAIVRSAHGYAGLGLGAGQVDFRAAQDALRPDSVPTLTAPADGATVAGVVSLSASSTAPELNFAVDGGPLGSLPQRVVGGTAGVSWSTYGVPNGPHTITAYDCSLGALCNTAVAQASVTVANEAPQVTSPTPSQLLTGNATFTASAPGGAVAFLVDGVRRGLDYAAPYTLASSMSALSDGTHTLTVVSCSATGSCNGPVSSPVTFRALSLHPRFSSVWPNLFSPNGDGRLDSSKATYILPDTEVVRFAVFNAAGAVVRGPVALGTQLAGTHSATWNGVLNTGARAPSGTYRLGIITSRATPSMTLWGSILATVVVDQIAPTMSSISGSGSGFYPYPDHYRDSFAPSLTLSERATVTMTVRTSSGALVRAFSANLPAGRTSIAWNGRNSAGALVPASTYYWTLTAQDPAGNRRGSARYSVWTSSRRLLTKTATLTRSGAQFTSAGGTDLSCAGADPTVSDFAPNGVWLSNVCDPSTNGGQVAAAVYSFTLPSAIGYTSLRVDAYGNSLAPSVLGVGFTRWGTQEYQFTTELLTGTTNAWRTLGPVSATGLVSSSHEVEGTIYVPNEPGVNSMNEYDYDLGSVHLVVTYTVLS
ncbi:S8 family serine peptidase [Nostocoides sp. HKS02]|uniref:S8 family serine peptidase n=1 Tax=Nostocoides sp. HKS02 TaxID=1813880 RepID=UPI0012B4F894|nr:S8 family serine peptidase [Tetrasphaera sp. HKS02]QGN57668.1 S8 family serine peptidase [Tetrasphaera sp. HKS02]